jgi:sec-independent protein translocase protein TatB
VDRELHLEEIKQSLRQQADLGEVKDLADRMKALHEDIQAEFDDPGPPPGWRPGMPTAAPPPGWTPPAVGLETPALAPVQLQKPVSALPAASHPSPSPSTPAPGAMPVSQPETAVSPSPPPPTAN